MITKFIEFKNRNNTKGIKITENNIRSWKRRKNGDRKYSNKLEIEKSIYERICKTVARENETEYIMLQDNNMKFIMDVPNNKVICIQHRVPFTSGLHTIKVNITNNIEENADE